MDDLLQEMIDPTPEPGDRPRRRRLVATIAIVGLAVVGITSLTTGALFTDRERTDDGFKTGTIDLDLAQPLKFVTTADNLVPGDTTYAAIDVRNKGSLELRYAIEYTATDERASSGIDDGVEIDGDAGTDGSTGGDLTDVLHLSVYTVGSEGDCSATPTSASLLFPASASNVPALTKDVATQLVGDKSAGDQTRDGNVAGDRTLGVGEDEWLCFVTTMDLDADNAYQDAGAQVTLDFYAEQTANND